MTGARIWVAVDVVAKLNMRGVLPVGRITLHSIAKQGLHLMIFWGAQRVRLVQFRQFSFGNPVLAIRCWQSGVGNPVSAIGWAHALAM